MKKMIRKVGIVIQARVGSTRLQGKVLKEIEGEPLIRWLIERLKRFSKASLLICAIPDSSENIHLKEICCEIGIPVFVGPEEDVLSRFIQAADHFGLTDVVRITADCPLLDPRLVDDFIEKHLSGGSDLTANLTGVEGGFPRGMDVEVVKTSTLHSLDAIAAESRFREHVTLYLYERPEQFNINIISPLPGQARPDLRMCVDEILDLEVVRAVYQKFLPRFDFSLEEVIAFLDENPEIKRLNHNVSQRVV